MQKNCKCCGFDPNKPDTKLVWNYAKMNNAILDLYKNEETVKILKRELLMVRNHTVSLRRELGMVRQELEWQKQQKEIMATQARMIPPWHNMRDVEVEVMKITMAEQEADKGIPAELEDK